MRYRLTKRLLEYGHFILLVLVLLPTAYWLIANRYYSFYEPVEMVLPGENNAGEIPLTVQLKREVNGKLYPDFVRRIPRQCTEAKIRILPDSSLCNYNQPCLFKYRVFNQDTQWAIIDTNVIQFAQIGKNPFVVQVKGVDENGRESESYHQIKFRAERYWLQGKSSPLYIGASLLLVLFVVAVFMYKKRKRLVNQIMERDYKNQIAQQSFKILQSRMNPHFVFNALSSIQYHLLNGERTNIQQYLSKLADLAGQVLHFSAQETITLEEEITFLRLYEEMEKLRFDDNLQISFALDQQLADLQGKLLIPPLLLQPLIENSLVHGFRQTQKQVKIKVSFLLTNGLLQCRVTDNGIGIEQTLAKNGKTSRLSSALGSIGERLHYFNAKHASPFDSEPLTIVNLSQSSPPQSGTQIILNMPLLTNTDHLS